MERALRCIACGDINRFDMIDTGMVLRSALSSQALIHGWNKKRYHIGSHDRACKMGLWLLRSGVEHVRSISQASEHANWLTIIRFYTYSSSYWDIDWNLQQKQIWMIENQLTQHDRKEDETRGAMTKRWTSSVFTANNPCIMIWYLTIACLSCLLYTFNR